MSRRFSKTLVVALLSSTLFYYGAAWALLRCFHDDDHSATQVESTASRAPAEPLHAGFPTGDPGELECLGLAYHAETLAGPASSSHHEYWAARINAHAKDLSISGVAGAGARGLWRSAVFDKVSSPAFVTGLPRYLSLSVLRI